MRVPYLCAYLTIPAQLSARQLASSSSLRSLVPRCPNSQGLGLGSSWDFTYQWPYVLVILLPLIGSNWEVKVISRVDLYIVWPISQSYPMRSWDFCHSNLSSCVTLTPTKEDLRREASSIVYGMVCAGVHVEFPHAGLKNGRRVNRSTTPDLRPTGSCPFSGTCRIPMAHKLKLTPANPLILWQLQ